MRNLIKIGIVEDDKLIAEIINKTLSRLGYETLPVATGYAEAMELIEHHSPDLMLIDIYLEGNKDGIDLAKQINDSFQIPFIFLTSDSQRATIDRAKSVTPPAYLIKPFTPEELYFAIEICLNNFSKRKPVVKKPVTSPLQNVIFVKDGNFFTRLNLEEINYLESDHVYVNIFTQNRKLTVRGSLNHFYEQLDKKRFFRVHRSYIVNINRVDSISNDHVVVNGMEVPSARKYHNELLQRLNIA